MIAKFIDMIADNAVVRWVLVFLGLAGGGVLLERLVRNKGREEGAERERLRQTAAAEEARAQAERYRLDGEAEARAAFERREARRKEQAAKTLAILQAQQEALKTPEIGTEDIRRYRAQNEADSAELERLRRENEK